MSKDTLEDQARKIEKLKQEERIFFNEAKMLINAVASELNDSESAKFFLIDGKEEGKIRFFWNNLKESYISQYQMISDLFKKYDAKTQNKQPLTKEDVKDLLVFKEKQDLFKTSLNYFFEVYSEKFYFPSVN